MNNNPLRGHFNSIEELTKGIKSINVLHAQDGYYEMRENRVFAGCAKSEFVYDLEKPPTQGIAFKIPGKIPGEMLKQVISFFRDNCRTYNNQVNEVMVQIYYNFDTEKYFVVVPKQTVKLDRIDYIVPSVEESSDLVVTIHSHPVFDAGFSPTDNSDEKKTGIYAVIGHLERPIPDIAVRASIGGNFIKLNVWDVFEDIFSHEYPGEWHNNVIILDTEKEMLNYTPMWNIDK